jgi:uncharacterized spore protein YtfJ
VDIEKVLAGGQEAMSVHRVFGDPISADGMTVIPVAKVAGGGGGGAKGVDESGGGFGIGARPAGVFVVRNGDVRWRPAIDVNRVILGGQLVAITALVMLGPAVRWWLTHRSTEGHWRDAPPAIKNA